MNMNIFTSKEDLPLSGTSSPLQKESISNSFFSSTTESYFRNSIKTGQIQGSSESLDKLLNFDFQALKSIQKDFPPDGSTVEQVCPQNLDRERLHRLTKRPKEISKIGPPVPIRNQDQEFSDSDGNSQGYRRTLCNKNLSGSNNSGVKRFQNGSHFSKLKLSKPNSFSNSVAASSSVMNIKPKKIGPDCSDNAVLRAILEQLRNEDKGTGYRISRKLKGDIINFKPSYEHGKLVFTCKVCDLYLHPEKVVSHAYSQAHLNFSKRNCTKPEVTLKNDDNAKSSGVPSAQKESNQILYELAKDLNKEDKKIVESFGQDSVNILNNFQPSLKSKERLNFICKVCQLSLYPKYVKSHLFSCTDVKDLRKNHSLVNLEDLNGADRIIVKKVIMDVNYKLFVFELFRESGSNELGFFCNVCRVAVIPMNVKDHINSNAHSGSLFTNPFSLEFKSLNWANKQIVTGIINVIKDGMKDFSLLYKTGTEELRFFCNVCQMSLCPDKVADHFKLSVHSNPAFTKHNDNRKFSEKSNSKKKFSNGGTTNRMTLPTEVTPDPTESSIPNSQPQSWTVVRFDSLTNLQKELVEKLTLQSNIERDCIDFLRGVGPNEFYIVCKFCCVTFQPALTPRHVESSDHLKNSALTEIFYNFVSLEESCKNVLRNLYIKFGSKLNVFSLIFGDKDKCLKFKCKSCDADVSLDTVNVDWPANHLDCKNRPVIKHTGDNCDKPAVKLFSQSNHEAAIRKTEKSRNLFRSSDGIHSSFATSSLHLTPLKEPNIEHKISKNNPSPKTNSVIPFNCHDCNATINFDAEKYNNLRERNGEWLLTNCCGKSADTILLICKKQKVSNTSEVATNVPSDVLTARNNLRKSGSGELSESDKATLKMLIDQIGMGIKDFDFILSTNSSPLSLNCKFCHMLLPPEAVNDHINSEAHMKYSQLGSVKNTGFEWLNDGNKINDDSLDSDEDIGTEAISTQNQWEKITKSQILDRSNITFGNASPDRSRGTSKNSCSLM